MLKEQEQKSDDESDEDDQSLDEDVDQEEEGEESVEEQKVEVKKKPKELVGDQFFNDTLKYFHKEESEDDTIKQELDDLFAKFK